MKDVGINRISIGGVDLDDKVLKVQQRGHTARETVELIQESKLRGFPHVVTDLIMGVQYQTPENWERTLDILIGDICEIDSAMTFPLMFKSSQINWRQYLRNPELFPGVKEKSVLQLIAMEKFDSAGYNQAPIYYFNRRTEDIHGHVLRKYESVDDTGLLAIGVSSFGFVNHHQYFNTPLIDEYNRLVESGQLPLWKSSKLTRRHKFERAVMFGLKSRGINKDEIKQRYGFDVDTEYEKIIETCESAGLLESTPEYLRLTRLGILFTEEICDKFAGEDVRSKAEMTAALVDQKDPIQRYNYNMIGHRLR
jgi:oxygen-independent coproporphyrinogen-3 oxidase